MTGKRLLIGTLVGGITLFLLGRLFWGFLFADFFTANAGSATGVGRDAVLLWASILGIMSISCLVTLALGWSGASSLLDGLKTGAIVGFLVWFGVNLIFYANFNLSNLTGALVDPVLELIRTGIAGAVIAGVLKKVGEG
jgi:hypothetical protein